MLRLAARAPPPGAEGGVSGLGGAQLPSPPLPGPYSLAPKWEASSCRFPLPHIPATCPVPDAKRRLRASRAEPTTLQPRAGREPASGAPLVGDQSSCGGGGAGGGFPCVREAVAEKPVAARAASISRAPAVPPSAAGEAGASAERTVPRAPGPHGRTPLSLLPRRPGLRLPAERPSLPSPLSFAFPALRRIWLLPRPPGDRRGEDTCFAGAPGRGLSGVGSAAATPGGA
ncbi:hypothetical protein P7K49_018363 [Saguinus oedipus]|uniref:Uncharacterized protein n=1 Tax=Saguinus oedipus TaxID=9490 RepID=A0ABQ9V564_SAGOE|nr:hypothetical protein P7K49_018363 [Saguinus oedipus]